MAVPIARGLDAALPAAGDPPALLVLLADGRLHSGQWLAQRLGVTRAAVWKGILKLRLRGIGVESVPRRGYRLPYPVELLDAGAIRAQLQADHVPRLCGLDVLFEVDSTNTHLLEAPPPPYGNARAVLGELQHAGRGRRGRQWLAPFGASLALSLGWSFADAARVTPALSLCVGVAVARALARAGAHGICLKWPNDIWFRDRKIGGVLLELRAEASGPAYVVIGVGINVQLAAAMRSRIEATGVRAAAVAEACATPPSRNAVAGAIIDELLSMLVGFEREGFDAFRAAWARLDGLEGRRARVLVGEARIDGTARGVSGAGALRLETADGMREFVSGEASLRLVEDDI